MDVFIKFIILSGKYLSKLTAQSIAEAYKRSIQLRRTLNQHCIRSTPQLYKYEHIFDLYKENLEELHVDSARFAFPNENGRLEFREYLKEFGVINRDDCPVEQTKDSNSAKLSVATAMSEDSIVVKEDLRKFCQELLMTDKLSRQEKKLILTIVQFLESQSELFARSNEILEWLNIVNKSDQLTRIQSQISNSADDAETVNTIKNLMQVNNNLFHKLEMDFMEHDRAFYAINMNELPSITHLCYTSENFQSMGDEANDIKDQLNSPQQLMINPSLNEWEKLREANRKAFERYERNMQLPMIDRISKSEQKSEEIVEEPKRNCPKTDFVETFWMPNTYDITRPDFDSINLNGDDTCKSLLNIQSSLQRFGELLENHLYFSFRWNVDRRSVGARLLYRDLIEKSMEAINYGKYDCDVTENLIIGGKTKMIDVVDIRNVFNRITTMLTEYPAIYKEFAHLDSNTSMNFEEMKNAIDGALNVIRNLLNKDKVTYYMPSRIMPAGGPISRIPVIQNSNITCNNKHIDNPNRSFHQRNWNSHASIKNKFGWMVDTNSAKKLYPSDNFITARQICLDKSSAVRNKSLMELNYGKKKDSPKYSHKIQNSKVIRDDLTGKSEKMKKSSASLFEVPENKGNLSKLRIHKSTGTVHKLEGLQEVTKVLLNAINSREKMATRNDKESNENESATISKNLTITKNQDDVDDSMKTCRTINEHLNNISEDHNPVDATVTTSTSEPIFQKDDISKVRANKQRPKASLKSPTNTSDKTSSLNQRNADTSCRKLTRLGNTTKNAKEEKLELNDRHENFYRRREFDTNYSMRNGNSINKKGRSEETGTGKHTKITNVETPIETVSDNYSRKPHGRAQNLKEKNIERNQIKEVSLNTQHNIEMLTKDDLLDQALCQATSIDGKQKSKHLIIEKEKLPEPCAIVTDAPRGRLPTSVQMTFNESNTKSRNILGDGLASASDVTKSFGNLKDSKKRNAPELKIMTSQNKLHSNYRKPEQGLKMTANEYQKGRAVQLLNTDNSQEKNSPRNLEHANQIVQTHNTCRNVQETMSEQMRIDAKDRKYRTSYNSVEAKNGRSESKSASFKYKINNRSCDHKDRVQREVEKIGLPALNPGNSEPILHSRMVVKSSLKVSPSKEMKNGNTADKLKRCKDGNYDNLPQITKHTDHMELRNVYSNGSRNVNHLKEKVTKSSADPQYMNQRPVKIENIASKRENNASTLRIEQKLSNIGIKNDSKELFIDVQAPSCPPLVKTLSPKVWSNLGSKKGNAILLTEKNHQKESTKIIPAKNGKKIENIAKPTVNERSVKHKNDFKTDLENVPKKRIKIDSFMKNTFEKKAKSKYHMNCIDSKSSCTKIGTKRTANIFPINLGTSKTMTKVAEPKILTVNKFKKPLETDFSQWKLPELNAIKMPVQLPPTHKSTKPDKIIKMKTTKINKDKSVAFADPDSKWKSMMTNNDNLSAQALGTSFIFPNTTMAAVSKQASSALTTQFDSTKVYRLKMVQNRAKEQFDNFMQTKHVTESKFRNPTFEISKFTNPFGHRLALSNIEGNFQKPFCVNSETYRKDLEAKLQALSAFPVLKEIPSKTNRFIYKPPADRLRINEHKPTISEVRRTIVRHLQRSPMGKRALDRIYEKKSNDCIQQMSQFK